MDELTCAFDDVYDNKKHYMYILTNNLFFEFLKGWPIQTLIINWPQWRWFKKRYSILFSTYSNNAKIIAVLVELWKKKAYMVLLHYIYLSRSQKHQRCGGGESPPSGGILDEITPIRGKDRRHVSTRNAHKKSSPLLIQARPLLLIWLIQAQQTRQPGEGTRAPRKIQNTTRRPSRTTAADIWLKILAMNILQVGPKGLLRELNRWRNKRLIVIRSRSWRKFDLSTPLNSVHLIIVRIVLISSRIRSINLWKVVYIKWHTEFRLCLNQKPSTTPTLSRS